MAKVIGNSAGGFATVEPVQNYLGQAIQNQEANAFKYREEQRDIAAKKAAAEKARIDALNKQAQQDLDDEEKLNAIKAKDSGISGINSAVVNGLQSEREKYIKSTQDYRKTRDKKYLIQRSEAMNNLQAISSIPEGYKKAVDNITKEVTDGTIDRSELKRITSLGDKIEKGFVTPKIQNGVMTFDVFERDPKTGQLSSIAINNMKGEDLINELTPHKKLDYNKHIKDLQGLAGNSVTNVVNGIETTGYPNADKFAASKADQLLTDANLLDDVAQLYGIEELATGGYSDQDKKAIYDRYAKDIKAGLNTGSRRDYEAERLALQREQEARQRAKDAKEEKDKSFTPPVNVVTKGGRNVALGIDIAKGDKILAPTYDKGKDGAIKGVVLRPDGSYAFSISTRKDNSLNANGLAKKRKFEQDTPGAEYEPVDADYVYSASKPTEFTTKKDANVVNNYVRGMINPANGKYFQNVQEYMQVYDKYKPAGQKAAAKKTAPAKAKSAAKKKVYAGVDEKGNIIWK